MIFELVADFADVLDAMPQEHPRHRILKLLDEAIRRDVHFIDRHPTTLFQCLWNTCWWYDCSEAVDYYEEPEEGWQVRPPWQQPQPRLSWYLDAWRNERGAHRPGIRWFRALCPPFAPLDVSLRNVLRGHSGEVSAVVWLREASLVGSVSADGTLRLWDADLGKEITKAPCGGSDTSLFACAPDETRLVTASRGGGIVFWSAELVKLSDDPVGANRCSDVTVSSNGEMMAFTRRNGTICVMPIGTGGELVEIQMNERVLPGLALSDDGTRLAGAFSNGIVRLWDTFSGAETASFPWALDTNSLNASRVDSDSGAPLAVTPRGEILAAAWDNRTVRVWDQTTQRRRKSQKLLRTAKLEPVKRLVISPDGNWLAIDCGLDCSYLYFLPNRSVSQQRVPGRFLSFSRNSQLFATAENTRVVIWDALTLKQHTVLHGHTTPVSRVSWYSDNTRLATMSEEGAINIWNPTDGSSSVARTTLDSPVKETVLSGDGQLALTISNRDCLRVWRVDQGMTTDCLSDPIVTTSPAVWRRHKKEYRIPTFSAEKTHVAVLTRHGAVVWDLETRTDIVTIQGATDAVMLRLSGVGEELAASFPDGSVRIWNTATSKLLGVIPSDGCAIATFDVHAGSHVNVAYDGGKFKAYRWPTEVNGDFTDTLDSDGPLSLGHSIARKSINAVEGWSIPCVETNETVGWLPSEFRFVTGSVDGRRWAGTIDDSIIVFVVEVDSYA